MCSRAKSFHTIGMTKDYDLSYSLTYHFKSVDKTNRKQTWVAGFRYLMPVTDGNWAWMLSSSTDPSGSTWTWQKHFEIGRSLYRHWPRRARLPPPHRLGWILETSSWTQLPPLSEIRRTKAVAEKKLKITLSCPCYILVGGISTLALEIKTQRHKKSFGSVMNLVTAIFHTHRLECRGDSCNEKP